MTIDVILSSADEVIISLHYPITHASIVCTIYRYMEENPQAGLQNDDSDQEIEYDEDGNPMAPPKSKIIDPLPPIDHTEIKYSDFEKNFYTLHPDIAALTAEQVAELRKTLGLKVSCKR